jgi:hypothetical protein
MMGFLEGIGGVLGLRRKRTFADRVEDTAERAFDAVRDAYSAAVESLSPVLERSGKVADIADRVADRTVSRARDSYTARIESLEPVLEKSLKVAEQAWTRAAKKSAAGISTAGDLATDAAATVSHTGKAAADTVGGAAAATGNAFATGFSWLWKSFVVLFKAALLAGVAYVGWQWLQSRREDQTWSMPGPAGQGYAGTPGTTTFTPSSTYGTVGSSAGAAPR